MTIGHAYSHIITVKHEVSDDQVLPSRGVHAAIYGFTGLKSKGLFSEPLAHFSGVQVASCRLALSAVLYSERKATSRQGQD
jgi:hypothetical protein